MKRLNYKEKGITLIALVITIIILLILAGVTLNAALSQNGLFKRAKDAGEKYKQAESNESQKLDEFSREIDQLTDELIDDDNQEYNIKLDKENEFIKVNEELEINATIEPSSGSIKWISSNNNIATVENGKVIGKKIGWVTITAKAGKNTAQCVVKVAANGNTELIDKNNNKYKVPDNFTIVPNGISNVNYEYMDDKNPSVQDGIVIEDKEENQFVWIPVGTINNRDNSTTEIKLGRYEFNDGIEKLKQDSDKYAENIVVDTYYKEFIKSTLGNESAKNLLSFLTKAKENHGYYIARYESGKNSTDENKPVSKAGEVWNFITQPKASEVARKMYEEDGKYESDLVNSYAWDTAIVFIQNYQSEETKYSKQICKNYDKDKTSPDNTGERSETTDKICNIYDLASNCNELITESYERTYYPPCVARGGNYLLESFSTYRGNCRYDGTWAHTSFRVLINVL